MSLRYLMNLYSYVIMVNYTTTYSRKNVPQRLFLDDIISSIVEIKFGSFFAEESHVDDVIGFCRYRMSKMTSCTIFKWLNPLDATFEGQAIEEGWAVRLIVDWGYFETREATLDG